MAQIAPVRRQSFSTQYNLYEEAPPETHPLSQRGGADPVAEDPFDDDDDREMRSPVVQRRALPDVGKSQSQDQPQSQQPQQQQPQSQPQSQAEPQSQSEKQDDGIRSFAFSKPQAISVSTERRGLDQQVLPDNGLGTSPVDQKKGWWFGEVPDN